jgi:DNA invertase Pin-like site-specific DNA recombinase
MNAIRYLRRSQRNKKYDYSVSIVMQRQSCDSYAQRLGFEHSGELVDDGVSGTDRDRFTRLAELVKTSGATHIIVYSIDRLARDVSGLLDELEKYEKLGVTIHCATQGKPISITRAHDFLAVGVEALVAQHYSKLISEKTRDAHERLKLEGKRRSRYLPAGYKLVDGRIEKDHVISVHLSYAHYLRKQGLTLRKIDTIMRGKGLKLAVSTWGRILK